MKQKEKTETPKPVKDHRFQIIGLEQSMRAKFLSVCKLNNKSGNEVIKDFMQDYIDLHSND